MISEGNKIGDSRNSSDRPVLRHLNRLTVAISILFGTMIFVGHVIFLRAEETVPPLPTPVVPATESASTGFAAPLSKFDRPLTPPTPFLNPTEASAAVSEDSPVSATPINSPAASANSPAAPINSPATSANSPATSANSPAASANSPTAPANSPATSIDSPVDAVKGLLQGPESWTSGEGITSTVKMVALLTILSLAPAILLMTTSFVRIITVLSILRQALGTGQIPPTQVLTALALFLTLLLMTPVWTDVYREAIEPYSKNEITAETALERGQLPIRTFLWKQIERSGNTDSLWLFIRQIPDAGEPECYEDVPWRALLPAFVLSELKVAFLIGFQIFLPFLIIDLVVSGVMVSMGMMMLPPAIVSLPFKLMLFVLTDGWTLVVKMLLESFVVA